MGSIEYGIAPPAFRLPDATSVGAVRLQVSNRERSIAYYQDVIGLTLVDEREAALGAPDGRVLVRLQERPGARAVPQSGVLGLFHAAILLPDRAALARFLTHIAGMGVPFGSADHLVSEAIYLWDPDGLGLEVYADRPRPEWPIRPSMARAQGPGSNRHEIAMATDPLDMASLIAADGDPWRGVPAGTTMGHVHLQVGDLDEARDFYHRSLGLDLVVWSYPGALFMSAGGYHHHVATNTWARRPQPAAEDHAQLLEWELVLPTMADVNATAASLAGGGFAMDDAQRVSDPWGVRVRVVAGSSTPRPAPHR